MRDWLEERLALGSLYEKYLRKAFPVHHSFYLGEIVLAAFITLVFTGAYLSVNYIPSDHRVLLLGQTVPEAYASIAYIDALPLGRVVRVVHHWSAHLMIGGILVHLTRVFVTGAYKKPREINWLVGVALLVVTTVEAFTGYALPDDAFSVTATRIGYGIAASVPWVGNWIAQVLFGGVYPTVHSLPRLAAAHVLWMPFALLVLIGVHLVIMVKQKHTQPPYAARIAPGRILGVPLWPAQASSMAILFFVYLAVLCTLSGALDVHPIAVFGPPTAATPSVRPDWYFLWMYGVLQIVPSWQFELWGGRFGPEVLGGVLLPSAVLLTIALVPFLDRGNARLLYAEPPTLHRARLGTLAGAMTFFGVGTLAGYHRELAVPVAWFWAVLLVGPVVVAMLVRALLRATFVGRR
jgi:cytochrome b-561